jgi:hypothetical protein
LLLIRSAIRRDWPGPADRRPRLLAEIVAGLDGGDPRRVVAVARVLLAADRTRLAPRSIP